MAEKGKMLFCQRKILVGVGFRENVVVFIGNGSVNELRVLIDVERAYRKTAQIFSIRLR